jgi:hypothetical protein
MIKIQFYGRHDNCSVLALLAPSSGQILPAEVKQTIEVCFPCHDQPGCDRLRSGRRNQFCRRAQYFPPQPPPVGYHGFK